VPRKPVTDLSAWPSLTLEGNLIAPAMVAAIGAPKDDEETRQSYRIRKGLSIRDEISTAFRVGQSHFDSFRKHINPSAEATRRFMREFLAETLGFDDLAPHEGAVALLAGGRVPVVVTPPDEEKLDRKSPTLSTERSRSAAFALQDYLNERDDALWGLATNGTLLRLMRDNASLTRPAYIEADLAQIFSNEDAASFSVLWLLCHRTRFGNEGAPATDCALERWRDTGSKEGEASRSRLAGQVKHALKILGSGFLEANPSLAEKVASGEFDRLEFKNELLRLVYRLIFLMVAEDRNLLHPPNAPAAARKLYAEGYSLTALRTLCTRGATWDRHHDRYEGVKILFRALTAGEEKLALPALGGLFAADQLPHLETARLRNGAFMEALYRLSWLTDEKKTGMVPVNWRRMETEELGSVYESLLELQPQIGSDGRSLVFAEDISEQKGNQQKLSGSYYTPDSLVQTLLDTALDPVLDQVEASASDPARALLELSVIDPACGSGHFLLGAARRIATRLARLRTEGMPTDEDFRHALRDVARCCIYGVDRNPMAVELTKVALWIETVDPGLPLGFLDHHLQCGDALLGLTDFAQLRKGIAKDAFTVLSGDNKAVCQTFATLNREGLKALDHRLANRSAELFDATDLEDALQRLNALEAMPDHSPAEVEAKAAAYTRFLAQAKDSPLAHACDLLVAAYLTPKTRETESFIPHTSHLLQVLYPQKGTPAPQAALDHATALCREARVFHWPLRFAHIFGKGGFSCVLGNPPWERIKLQEQEFFAAREPLIAEAKNKAERAKRIQWLSEGSLHYHVSQFQSAPPPDRSELTLFRQFEKEKRLAEATSAFAHVAGAEGGRFPLTGVGDVNTYALFAETIEQIRARSGRAGFIVPTGIATDDSTKAYFSHIAEGGRLARLIDFENREKVFPGIDSRIKFSLITLGSAESAVFSFFLTQTDQLADKRRSFALAPADFALINPNTRTCPVFRTQTDAELTRKIYRRVPVLIREARGDHPAANPWCITFSAMIHMANDSHLFLDAAQPDSLPLYEAKMMHQFDHRWATYQGRKMKDEGGSDGVETADVTDAQKADPTFRITPRYWVAEREVLARLARAPKAVRDAFRDQNVEALLAATAVWIEAGHDQDLLSELSSTTAHQRVCSSGGPLFGALPPKQADWLTDKALSEARQWPPLTEPELAALRASSNLTATLHQILDTRSPRWLMGWRDITNATNERTVIASVVPRAGCGDTLLLMFPTQPADLVACLLADQNSLVHDFVARQKIGGTHLKYHVKKQVTNLHPSAYSEADLLYIVPRVLELTYTAEDMRPWYEEVITSWNAAHPSQAFVIRHAPFAFCPSRRAELRAELDALYARLYGLTREELEYILDPATTHGPDYPTVTFPGLKNNDLKNHGEYRTQRLALEAWDRMEAKGEFSSLEL